MAFPPRYQVCDEITEEVISWHYRKQDACDTAQKEADRRSVITCVVDAYGKAQKVTFIPKR